MLIEINGVNGQYASINPDHIVRAVSSAGKGGWLAVVTLTGSPGTTLVSAETELDDLAREQIERYFDDLPEQPQAEPSGGSLDAF